MVKCLSWRCMVCNGLTLDYREASLAESQVKITNVPYCQRYKWNTDWSEQSLIFLAMTFLSILVLPECVIMLAGLMSEGAGRGVEGVSVRRRGKAEQAKTSEFKTSKTLQCCHLQAKNFQGGFYRYCFLTLNNEKHAKWWWKTTAPHSESHKELNCQVIWKHRPSGSASSVPVT